MPDTTTVDKAFALGPMTADLDLDVARTYAACSAFATNDRERQSFSDRVFDALTDGVRRGLTQADLDEIAEIDQELTRNPRWHALLEKPLLESQRSSAELMLDPIPEILTHLPPFDSR